MNEVTVIMPVKNGMPYLRGTLESLQRQTLQNFQILVWENGSTDGTLECLNEWIPHRLPGRIIHDQPLPYDASLAKLVEQATTPYLARLDADDIALPNRLEKQAAYLDLHPDTAAIGGQMELIDETGASLGPAEPLPPSFSQALCTMLFRSPLPHPGVMLRRSAVLAAGNYANKQPVEDLDLWIRLAKIGPILNLPDVVVKYRVHSKSVTHTAKAKSRYSEIIFECLTDGLPSLYPLERQAYRRMLAKEYPVSLGPLWPVVRAISRMTGLSPGAVACSREFLYSARCLTREGDWISKACYRMLDACRGFLTTQQ